MAWSFRVITRSPSFPANSSSSCASDLHKCWDKGLVCCSFASAGPASLRRSYRSYLMSDHRIDLPGASLDDEGDLSQGEQAMTRPATSFDEVMIYGGDGNGQSILRRAIWMMGTRPGNGYVSRWWVSRPVHLSEFPRRPLKWLLS